MTPPVMDTGRPERHEASALSVLGLLTVFSVELGIPGPPQGVLTMSIVKKLVGKNKKVTA
jgi:hypothetical protein